MSHTLFNLPAVPMELGIEVAREAREPGFKHSVMEDLGRAKQSSGLYDLLIRKAGELADGDPDRIHDLLLMGCVAIVAYNKASTLQQVESLYAQAPAEHNHENTQAHISKPTERFDKPVSWLKRLLAPSAKQKTAA